MELKLIGGVGPFEAYRYGGEVVIYEGDERFVQFGRRDGLGFNDPLRYCREVLDARAEAEADKVATRRTREKFAAAYLAGRVDRAARQPQFRF